MRAFVTDKYGAVADVLQLKEVPKPVPTDNEVLIKVMYATVNRTDIGFQRGTPHIVRLFSGLTKPKIQVHGSEFSGVVEALGSGVANFNLGDRVFGWSDEHRFGAHAEYMVVTADSPMATIPENMTYEQAAPMLEGAHYAWNDIKAAKVAAGHNVLVNGATGAIGSAAVQLVKHLGATVTAVCATPHIATVKGLGADVVVDYLKEDFTKTSDTFDFVFDAVGKSTFGKCRRILKPKGIYISTEFGPYVQNPFLALITPLLGGKKLLFPIPSINQEDAEFFRMLAETNQYRPLIDRTYPFEQLAHAFAYVETGQKIGNVLVRIG
jgi:NADPH:quinone reductase-like Zn-dependent oxidoreductase